MHTRLLIEWREAYFLDEWHAWAIWVKVVDPTTRNLTTWCINHPINSVDKAAPDLIVCRVVMLCTGVCMALATVACAVIVDRTRSLILAGALYALARTHVCIG